LPEKKEEIMVCIFLNTIIGNVNIQIPDSKRQELESLIKKRIKFSRTYIKARGLSEETLILEKIKNRLSRTRKPNGITVKETSYRCW